MQYEDKKLVEGFIRRANIAGFPGDSTLQKYKACIERFSIVMKVDKIADLRMVDFEEFVIKMKKRDVTNSYIGNVIAAMKWLLGRYQEQHGKVNGIVVDDIIKPRVARKEVEYLSTDEIKVLIKVIKSDNSKGPAIRKERFLTLIMVLLQTGGRIGEVLSINKTDIDRENGEVPIIGKAKKPRHLFLTSGAIKQIDHYLGMRTDNHEALFVALNGKSRWAQTDVNRTFARYRKLSGINKRFTNHTLRHTFATLLMDKGAAINTIQYLLGHANPVITMKFYIGIPEKKRAKGFMKDEYFDFLSEI